MANTIKIRSGVQANVNAATAATSEFLFTTDTKNLYIGLTGGSKHLLVSGEAGVAKQLETARNFSITGDDATAAAIPFDGTANVALELILAASGIVAGTYTKVTFDSKGRATYGDTLEATDIPALTLSKITDAGTSASHDVGTSAGNVPVLDSTGKLNNSVLPGLSITDIFTVSSQSEMLALTNAEQGDVAIRLDIKKTFILLQSPASTLSNWHEFLSPDSPVQSVNGQVGVVVIENITGNAGTATALETPREINGVEFDGTENITITDSTKEPVIAGSTAGMYWNGLKQFVSFANSVMSTVLNGLLFSDSTDIADGDTIIEALGKLQAQSSLKAPINSPNFTGVPTVPTAAVGASNYQAVNAEWVTLQGYLDENSTIDGGTF